jgi:hypothetical protein
MTLAADSVALRTRDVSEDHRAGVDPHIVVLGASR